MYRFPVDACALCSASLAGCITVLDDPTCSMDGRLSAFQSQPKNNVRSRLGDLLSIHCHFQFGKKACVRARATITPRLRPADMMLSKGTACWVFGNGDMRLTAGSYARA